MNLEVSSQNEIKKKLFTLKNTSQNGLILRIHHTNEQSQKVRFIQCCFNNNGQILACSDNSGNTFIIDLLLCKFWNFPNVESCTVLKFSLLNPDDILIGLNTGTVLVIHIETGSVIGKLIGHKHSVKEISFSTDFLCLTSSNCEAIIWDLKTNTKVQILALDQSCIVKHVLFMPVSNNILACFKDDVIQVWKYGSYENFKQILPGTWNSFTVRSIAFAKNGRDMVFAGHSSRIAVFQLNKWQLTLLITLPEYVLSIRQIEFLSQSFDGGCNRILAILSGQGVIYFYDVDQNYIISELTSYCEIVRFDVSNNGNQFACCLCTGEVEIYDVIQYIVQPLKTVAAKAVASDGKIRLRRSSSKVGFVKREITEVLDIEKLRDILKEFGEYPDSYRVTIWEHLLALPENKDQYNALINHITMVAFEDLPKRYPLENKANIRNLKKLLNNIVTWCPFFFHVDYLPVFCFPFVTVFSNKPVSCFEAVCTILINWCQYWFEYFPLPPINVLAITENVLLEHDPDLLDHFTKCKVTTKDYIWPLLETAFSEVLTAPQWLTFWDHILTNEPALLLCAAVAYCIIHRVALFAFKTQQQFHTFFHYQNPLDVKKLLSKSYKIIETTSETMHPRQYLNMFKRIELGQYPKFMDYPKAIVDYQTGELSQLKKEMEVLEQDEINLSLKRKSENEFVKNVEAEEIEKERIYEMEKAVKQKLLYEQEQVKKRQEKLAELREKLHKEEEVILQQTQQKMLEYNDKERKRVLDSLMLDLKLGSSIENFKSQKAEEELRKHYNELLNHRQKIEIMLRNNGNLPEQSTEHEELLNNKIKLQNEIEEVFKASLCKDHLKQLNIATGLKAVDELIHRVENQLISESCMKTEFEEEQRNLRVHALKAESKALEYEVGRLLKLLSGVREKKDSESELPQPRTSLTLRNDEENVHNSANAENAKQGSSGKSNTTQNKSISNGGDNL